MRRDGTRSRRRPPLARTRVGILGATALLINPMNRFSIFFADFARAFVGAGRVFEILDLPVEPEDPPGARARCRACSRRPFEHVGFAYDAGRPVLRDFTAEMLHVKSWRSSARREPGRARSSTWFPRFYEPQQAASTVDGVDIAGVRLADLRDAIAIVRRRRSSSTARSPRTSGTGA